MNSSKRERGRPERFLHVLYVSQRVGLVKLSRDGPTGIKRIDKKVGLTVRELERVVAALAQAVSGATITSRELLDVEWLGRLRFHLLLATPIGGCEQIYVAGEQSAREKLLTLLGRDVMLGTIDVCFTNEKAGPPTFDEAMPASALIRVTYSRSESEIEVEFGREATNRGVWTPDVLSVLFPYDEFGESYVKKLSVWIGRCTR